MKLYNIFGIFLVVSYSTFARTISTLNNNIEGEKIKRDESSSECKYINGMLGENESYNCCGRVFKH